MSNIVNAINQLVKVIKKFIVLVVSEVRAKDSNGLKLYDDDSKGIFIEDGGNVGIGTESPGALFDVGGGSSDIGGITKRAVITANNNSIQSLHIQNINAGTAAEMRLVVASDESSYMAFTTPSVGNIGSFFGLAKSTGGFLFARNRILALGTNTNQVVVFGSNNIERMRITGSGEVGIGTTTPDTKLQVIGDLKVGDDDTNYAKFDTDGELTLVGTARVKKTLCISFEPGATPPSKQTYGVYYFDMFDIGDVMHAAVPTPSDWDPSTGINVYLVWGINEDYATNNGEVQWKIDWAETAEEEDFSAPAVSGTLDSGDINIPATAKTKITSLIGAISSANLTAGDCLGLKLSRVALDGGNNPTAEPVIAAVLIEYTANKLGEAT